MLSSKVDTLLMFQPPTREILQQKDIHLVAKRYFDLFSFTDSALVFLKRYLTENLTLVKHFDKTSTLLNQECHNFYSAWPKLHNDPSPLISILFFQLENIEALACSFPPLDYKSEEQVREGFLTKINNIKTVQQSLDKNFQTLWKQCQTQTSTYYQKLEEYKEQTDKVRRKYEKYEKQTRDFKSYNVTWVKKLEEKLAQRVATLKKSKEAYDQASNEAQEGYKAILVFFESNKTLIQEFLKLFLSTLVELSIFLVERIQESTGNMKQTTLEILQKIKKLDVKGSWDDEDAFIRKSSQEESQEVGYIKEMNRVNHHRQEFLSSVGGLSQEAMHLCQEFVEKSNFFEEISTFENFFTQFDDKITGTLLPFGDFLMSLKQIFVSFFVAEKNDSEQIIHKLALQRSNAYSSLVDALSKSLNASNMSSPQKRAGIQLDSPGLPNTKSPEVVKTAVSDFLQIEENLGKILIKDLERLYTAINTGIWNKILQVGQKCLMNFQDKLKDENLNQEVSRIQANLVNEVDHIKEELDEAKNKIYNTEFVRTRSQMEEDLEMVADEKSHGAGLNGINKYNQHEFKFFKEKKAESLAGFVKKQNEEKLKEINPNPYTVDFEKSKTNVSARDDDSILGSFSCAFVENMLLQGRIYITTNKIVFKSYFNGRTLFGQTLLSIPLEDIVYVAKKKNALGLENMIEITTKKGELTFTSFVFRDKAFAMIDQVLTTLNPEYAKSPKGRRSVNADAIEGDLPLEDEIVGESAEAKRARRHQKKEMDWQRRNRAVIKAMPPLSKYDQLAHSHQYEIDYNTFAKTLFSPDPLEFKGKTYSCCWELIDERLGSYEITTTNWSQPVPKNFTRRKDLLPYKGGLERTTTGTRDLNMPVPLLPKNMTSKQTHRLFFVSESQSLMFLEMDTSQQKIPFSDAFKFYTCYIVTNESKEEGKPLVSVHLKYYVEWFYDTMFKKVISKATADEFTKSGPIFDTAIHDLMSAGIFEKRKQEYAAEDQAVETEEDDEDENEENNAGAEEQGLEGDGQEEAQSSTEQNVGTKAGKKEFKVSKRVVFLYFSVSLILLSYVFTMIVLK